MTARDKVSLVRNVEPGDHAQECHNRVQLEDENAGVINDANPLPVSLPGVLPATPLPVDVVASIVPGNPFDIVVTPTISAGAIYAAGDALGGLLEFPNAVLAAGGRGTITKVVIIDEDQELTPIDLILFNQTFGATVDNAPFDPTDADLANVIGHINIPQTAFVDFVDNSQASKQSGLNLPFDYQLIATGTSLFGQMVVAGGATPTYTAVDDITIKITVVRYTL